MQSVDKNYYFCPHDFTASSLYYIRHYDSGFSIYPVFPFVCDPDLDQQQTSMDIPAQRPVVQNFYHLNVYAGKKNL